MNKGILIIGLLLILIPFSGCMTINRTDNCVVCEWNWYSSELHDYHDPGYGLSSPLEDIWNEANYGKSMNLVWYENIRLKYNLTSVRSFSIINYSNPRPSSPSLMYLGTGYIVNYTPWSYSGLAYPLYIINYSGSNHSFSNCANNPYPLNMSNPVYVFRTKNGAWWNMFKEASLYDATVYSEKANDINNSWIDYNAKYSVYLSNGGIDLGIDY